MEKYLVTFTVSLLALSIKSNSTETKYPGHLFYLSKLKNNSDSKLDCSDRECNLPYDRERRTANLYSNNTAMPVYTQDLFKDNKRSINFPRNRLERLAFANFNRNIPTRTFRRARDPGFYKQT